KLLEHVVIDYLAGYRPVLLRVAALLGIVNVDNVPPDPNDPAKRAYQRHDLIPSNVGSLISDPAGYLLGLYGWNTGNLAGASLLRRTSDLLAEFGVPASFDAATATLRILPFAIAPTSGVTPQGLSAILAYQITDGMTLPLPSLLPVGWGLQLVVK